MKWSLAFVGIGLGTFLVQFLMGLSFSIAGARLVERVRRLMFEAMLNQVPQEFSELGVFFLIFSLFSLAK